MTLHEFDNISAFDYRDMRAWCREQFGKGGIGRWYSLSNCDDLDSHDLMKWRGAAYFKFNDDKDFVLFSLRWS